MTLSRVTVIGIILVTVGYFAGCNEERRRQKVERDKISHGADSVIAQLRVDSAALATQRNTLLARALETRNAQIATAESLAIAKAQLVNTSRRINDAVRALAKAETAADSLLRYPILVSNLLIDRDSARMALDLADRNAMRQEESYRALKRIQESDSIRADIAEQKASAFQKLNLSIKDELAAERSKWGFRLKAGGATTLLIGAGILCILKC